MTGTIYLATNLINNKKYVGQTKCSFERRKRNHLSEAKNNPRRYFQKAIRKYGEDNFSWMVLEQKDFEDEKKCFEWMDEREIFYIAFYNSNNKDFGYNLTKGGSGHCPEENAENRREHNSLSRKEYWSHLENRKAHKEWMNDFYKTDVGIEQAKRHKKFMEEYYNGEGARKNKARIARFFVKAISPNGEETIYISTKEPNETFKRDVHIRQHLKKVGDIWKPGFRATKDIQGWTFEAIPKDDKYL